MTHATSVDVIHEGAELGEGPVWDAAGGRLIWVDILVGQILTKDPATGQSEVLEVGKPVSAVALRSTGGLVAAVEDGFAVVDSGLAKVQQVATVEPTQPASRFNDGKCDPRGRFWAGTMAYDETRGAGIASLFRLSPEYAVEQMLAGVTTSNGLGWSADERTFFYTDSPTGGVDAFDYDPDSGSIANRRRVITIEPDAGVPDGLAIDSDGCLWVAVWSGGEVRRYSPDGVLDRRISLPASNITSCAFGGSGLDTLFITSARWGLNEDELAQQPLAGSVFAVDPRATGLLPQEFSG
jgi:sugar lactone lactonase YvrE